MQRDENEICQFLATCRSPLRDSLFVISLSIAVVERHFIILLFMKLKIFKQQILAFGYGS